MLFAYVDKRTCLTYVIDNVRSVAFSRDDTEVCLSFSKKENAFLKLKDIKILYIEEH